MGPGTGGAGQDPEGSNTSCSVGDNQSGAEFIQCRTQGMLQILVKRQHAVPGAVVLGDAHPRTPWPLPASHLLSLMMRFETKSLASSETLSKVSSSKYQLAAKTLLSVSVSSSPKKGERPLSLGVQGGEESGALRLQHLPDPLEESQSGQGCSRDVLAPSCAPACSWPDPLPAPQPPTLHDHLPIQDPPPATKQPGAWGQLCTQESSVPALQLPSTALVAPAQP